MKRGFFRVRRSPHLVSYWRDGALILRNYATGEAASVSPILFALLDLCGDWRTIDDIVDALPAQRTLVVRAIRRLTARTFLERSDRKPDPREQRMKAFDPWNPEAGLFHTATKRVRFWSPQEAARQARMHAALVPMPRPIRRYPGAQVIDLPRGSIDDEFSQAVHGRRTWRRFSTASVSLADLSVVLAFGCGIQKWVTVGRVRIPLKTSPSGGARHPIECYVVIQHVAGIRPGVYHYAADRHALERLRGPVTKLRIREYMPHSGYFAEAPVLFFLTAVFARQLWRYPYSRAYRAALIEAGHVCQTMLLTATWLGLAPFSLMGLADPVIERDLRLDGITESVLYAAGLGRPPARTAWAPLPRGTLQVRNNRRFG